MRRGVLRDLGMLNALELAESCHRGDCLWSGRQEGVEVEED
jgi:hypothetical protein